MKLKRIIIRLTSILLLFAFSSTIAFAELNLGNDDGTNFKSGTSNNYWGVHTDGGIPLNNTEGLRVTIYDAKTNDKAFNTIDITGNVNISAASSLRYFSDGAELISKTTWLSYVSSTYNSLSESDMTKFNNAVTSRLNGGNGYRAEYIPELASVDIVSVNNTSNLAAIKEALSSVNFLKNLCDLIGGGLKYEDIAQGKYKIAFEPVAYFRYNGQNWAMSATECGLLNKYMKNYFTAGWNSTNNLRALLGPLTHSNLPRSAFLENKDLGISVYSPASSDYYNGNSNYNSDTCIIRCMGIGVLNGEEPPDEEINEESTSTAEYHTDTDVYTSFNVTNVGDVPFVGSSTFSITDSKGNTPKITEELAEEQVVVKRTNKPNGPPDITMAYPSDEVKIKYAENKEETAIDVYVDNPDYTPDADGNYPYNVPPFILLGSYKDGDPITLNIDSINNGNSVSAGINYTVKTRSGSTIASGTVQINCPADESSMGWFKWHTPTRAQDVVITLKSNNPDLLLVDENGEQCEKLIIDAGISKVEEITPPDPKVTDTRPSWQKVYSMASVQGKITDYVPTDAIDELSWYTWTYDFSWGQNYDTKKQKIRVITAMPPEDEAEEPHLKYLGAETEMEEISLKYWGVDNRYYSRETAKIKSGKFESGAVYISTQNIKLEKVEYTVSVSADITLSPSNYCKTASYNALSGKYTMKSGYGVQISVDPHISGDTEYCTGSQSANVLFPEFNYNRQSSAKYNRLLEKVNGSFVFKENIYSTYKDRVHFTPIWFPDKKNYTVYVEVFDVWCPAGQLSVRLTDQIYIKGNVYDDWHIAPVKP